jgi:hypothetical protein
MDRDIQPTASPLWARQQKGRRYGLLQIIQHIGVDQASGEHCFLARCGHHEHRLSMAEITNDSLWSCPKCNPPKGVEVSARAEHEAEQRWAESEAERKRLEIAEKNRRADEERQSMIRRRQREFLTNTGEFAAGQPAPPPKPPEVWLTKGKFRPAR